MKNALLSMLLLCWSGGLSVSAAERTGPILDGMARELQRNKADLSVPDYPAPYYLSYQIRETRVQGVRARFGAEIQRSSQGVRLLYVDVRVGSPDLDNSEDPYPEFTTSMRTPMYQFVAPVDDNTEALEKILWLATDTKYKEAVASYLKIKAQKIYEERDPDFLGSMSLVGSVTHEDSRSEIPEDLSVQQGLALTMSRMLETRPYIYDSTVTFEVRIEDRYFVNSEGSRIYESQPYYSYTIEAFARAEDGTVLPYSMVVYGRALEQFPSSKEMALRVERFMDELGELSNAELMQPFSGPALLEGDTAGVFIHEALGHRLEGHRQHGGDEGGTFKGKVGDMILPDFVSVRDDPTLAEFNGQGVNGYYRFDDEGVAAQAVDLVTDGRLSGFLLTRRPIKGFGRSNGHARAAQLYRPVARMGTLIVSGKKPQGNQSMKKRLMELARKQGKPYGILLRRAASGATNTSSWGFQAFKGVALLVYQVDARTGRETLVRGVELVGTPLSSLTRVEALGDDPTLFNGYCGAESGMVPVSMITPSILMTELEFQKSMVYRERKEILPPP
jgi:predicted Zn-dependent protease